MTGYVRQSAADIVPTGVVRAAPINNELNALRDAFSSTGGHKHDGTAAEGHPVPLIGDSDMLNKIATDTSNNRHGVFVEVGGAAVEQVRFQDGAIVPVTDNDIDLGTSSNEFKNLFITGTANIDSLVADTADINGGTVDGAVIGGSSAAAGSFTTIGATGAITSTVSTGTAPLVIASTTKVSNLNVDQLDGADWAAPAAIGTSTPAAGTFTSLTANTSLVAATADINGGTLDGAVIGASSAQAITGTTVTATTGFVGGLTGNVTGNTTGTHTGGVIGNVTGDVTGNITASTGTSSFNDVTINGTLNMNAGTSATITNLTSPTNSGDAATKGYVDTADALKLNLSGGTMSGAIAMGTNKITGLGTPTANADAATKVYVDTSISNLVASAPGLLDTLDELAAALGDDPNFATTVTNSIATKLPLAGGTMSGAIAMGTNKITGLGDPTLAQDAATKTYVDTADALKLNLSGGTMSGAIAMGTNKITGLGNPTANQDAATKTYVDTADALKLSLTGGTMSGAIAMGTSKITGLGTPTDNADATTKLYVDGILGSATSAAASAAAAATSASNAATSASNASTSATNAASSASSASTSATNAAASYDAFDDRYLGSKTSAPSVDNDGNALLTGALYWNSTSSELYLWTGSAWTRSALSGTDYVAKSGDTMTGALTTTGLTLSGGTANGVTYLNGSKVLTSGSALTFDGTNLSNSGYYIGTAAVGRLTKSNTTGRNLFTGGVTGGTTDGAYIITEGYDYGGTAAGGAINLVTAGASSPITFLINGSEIGRFTSAGLGIGTTPSAWSASYRALQSGNGSSFVGFNGNDQTFVVSNAYNDGSWKYKNTAGAGYYAIQGVSNGVHAWYTAPSGTAGNAITFTQAMTLDASSNLALGTTTQKVTQFGGSATGMTIGSATYPVLALWDTADASYNFMLAQDGGTAYVFNNANGPLTFSTNATERARITSTGNFVIGATTASNKLEVNGSARFYTAANGDVSITHSGLVSSITAAGSVSLAFGTNNTEKARISTAGGFSVGTTADAGSGGIYATGNITAYYSSDRKFKENVKDIPNALDIVTSIGAKTFDWTDEYLASHGGEDVYFQPKQSFGVIAQDVQAVFPQAVRTRQDGSLAVDYEKLAILSFGAIGQLLKRVEALEAK